MCLAKAFLEGAGERELVLEEVVRVEVGDRTVRLSTLFGEERELAAVLKAVDFQAGSVLLEAPG